MSLLAHVNNFVKSSVLAAVYVIQFIMSPIIKQYILRQNTFFKPLTVTHRLFLSAGQVNDLSVFRLMYIINLFVSSTVRTCLCLW